MQDSDELLEASVKLLNPEDPERETVPQSDSEDEDYPDSERAIALTQIGQHLLEDGTAFELQVLQAVSSLVDRWNNF